MPDELPGADALVRSEEQLVTGVEQVPYERVLLRRRVVTETVTTVTEVRREELVVERVPLGDDAPAGEAPASDADLEIVLHEEQVVTTTRVVPYELVRVRRTATTRDEDVTATLRREEIDLR